ncbi:hypothetical protein FJR39_24980 [Dolichospermum flos-aquae UHCC 0037]|uniref:Uncharacterized protein n=1 Tax=Dolichospermum flos-aquae UHCC 0037 TaxID=2590026 RepID=A0ACC7SE07_DOLFA|nr:hypothetical protein [Dolichospermum flos-aquae UHCC 0037]
MARQKARGKSEEGLGDFTFLYTVWFYCVHLLRIIENSFCIFPGLPYPGFRSLMIFLALLNRGMKFPN